MADVRVGAESETPVNPYSLLEAVNNSSESAHTAWLIFLALMAYITIAVAGVTHRDLLLETPVALPIMQVAIQQALFFEFAPVLLVVFHLGVITQLVLLARKTLEFDHAVRSLELTERRTHPLRLELHNFYFVQAVAGPHRSAVMSFFLQGMAWLTLVALPIVILLFVQLTYLPFHNVTTTWVHRVCVVVDIAILVLIGVFLVRSESSFFSAFWRTTISNPVSFLITVALMTAVLFFSMLVATVPGEALDRTAAALTGGDRLASPNAVQSASFSLPFTRARPDGVWGRFYRYLVVPDAGLVHDGGAATDEVSISLRNRDLRFAVLDRTDLRRADLTGADLRGASLSGADLSGARLQCADVAAFILTGDRGRARCVGAQGVNFRKADLSRARMAGIDVRDAAFDEAVLEGADLSHAWATGANFASARLDKADLSGGVHLQGASFLVASLQGADLSGAQLQGADLSSASMQAASLSIANLSGAALRDADLEGADLQYATLLAADMSGARLRAADLRGARVWMVPPPNRDELAQADLSALALAAPAAGEAKSLREEIERIDLPRVRSTVADALAPLLDAASASKWAQSGDSQTWQALVTASTTAAGQDGYPKDLTDYLGGMACKARYASGAVAIGVLKRAIGTSFRGTIGALYDRLRTKDCAAADNVPKALLARAAASIDASPAR